MARSSSEVNGSSSSRTSGMVQESAGDREALPHAAENSRARPSLTRSGRRGERFDSRFARDRPRPAVRRTGSDSPWRKGRRKRRCRGPDSRCRAYRHANLAFRAAGEIGEDAQEGGLPRPVAPEQRQAGTLRLRDQRRAAPDNRRSTSRRDQPRPRAFGFRLSMTSLARRAAADCLCGRGSRSRRPACRAR